MALFKSKSKNIHLYKHFFEYDNPDDIDFEKLAKKIGESRKKLSGMMRAATKNFQIYLALRKRGHPDSSIPSWFFRPPQYILDYLDHETASTRSSAQQRPMARAEDLSTPPPKHPIKPSLDNVSPRKSNVYSGTLSTAQDAEQSRKDGPGFISTNDGKWRPLPANYQTSQEPPMEPWLREFLDKLHALAREPKAPPQEVLKAQYEAEHMIQEAQNLEIFKMMIYTQLQNERPKNIDLKELAEILSDLFKEQETEKKENQEYMRAAFKSAGEIYRPNPYRGPDADTIQKLSEAKKKNQVHEAELIFGIAKKIMDRRNEKHPIVQELENQFQNICDNFFKNIR